MSLACFASIATAHAVEWIGRDRPVFSDSGNWQGEPLVANADNPRGEAFSVVNGDMHPLRHTASQGITNFGAADGQNTQFIVGFKGRSGALGVTGGELRIHSYWSSIIGQLGGGTVGTIHVSGGIMRVTSASRSLPRERFFRVGNTEPRGRGARGTLLISGGLMVVETEGGPEPELPGQETIAGGLNVGRGGGRVYITGGRLRVTGAHGTSFLPDNGSAPGVLRFGLGDGVFEQTSSARITFGSNPLSTAYITFDPGGGGAISLAGATRRILDDYITRGRIRVDGELADPSCFKFTVEGGQGVLRLSDR